MRDAGCGKRGGNEPVEEIDGYAVWSCDIRCSAYEGVTAVSGEDYGRRHR